MTTFRIEVSLDAVEHIPPKAQADLIRLFVQTTYFIEECVAIALMFVSDDQDYKDIRNNLRYNCETYCFESIDMMVQALDNESMRYFEEVDLVQLAYYMSMIVSDLFYTCVNALSDGVDFSEYGVTIDRLVSVNIESYTRLPTYFIADIDVWGKYETEPEIKYDKIKGIGGRFDRMDPHSIGSSRVLDRHRRYPGVSSGNFW